jgi:ferric-dicitrate binding protein FerR (iron transport regulator)
MSDMRAPDRIEEAARWFAARRRGVMTVEERARYQAWFGDPANASAMAQLDRAWSALGAVEDRLLDAMREPAPQPRSRYARSALLAAMCVVSLGIGVLSYSDDTGFWTTLNWTDR